MKKIALMFSALFLAVACTNDPTPTTQFVRQDILGEWSVSQVAYSGEMPNPLNPAAMVQFSGLGAQLIGEVNLYEMPDTGNIDIAFVADLSSIQVPVSLKSSGTWTLTNNDSTLVLDNDSVSFNFVMVSGLPTQQVWTTSFMQVPADSSYWADIDLELTVIK